MARSGLKSVVQGLPWVGGDDPLSSNFFNRARYSARARSLKVAGEQREGRRVR
jgi:hypothetical protein